MTVYVVVTYHYDTHYGHHGDNSRADVRHEWAGTDRAEAEREYNAAEQRKSNNGDYCECWAFNGRERTEVVF